MIYLRGLKRTNATCFASSSSGQLEKVLAQAGVERITVEPGKAFYPTYQEDVALRYEKWVSQPSRQSSHLAIYMKTSFSGWQPWLSLSR